jgi:tRNA-dihydrouridine synthase B
MRNSGYSHADVDWTRVTGVLDRWKKEHGEICIGSVKLENPFVLGPMAGFTDAPMRRICREMGASLTYTEMVSAKALHYGDEKSRRLLFTYPDETHTAYQIFGHEPDIMAEAAEKLEELPGEIIDINMGCPVPKVFKNGDGSALSKDPELAEKVIHAVVTHSSKPVTAKIRLGIDDEHINCVEMAQALESGGASAVAVHGRTRVQYYEGAADWEKIADVRKALTIPVIANGDVTGAEQAADIMESTGCGIVMIARAALGYPWIFRDLDDAWNGREMQPEPDLEEKKLMMIRQLDDMIELKGEYSAVREMRKVAGFYLKGLTGGAKMRGIINRVDDPDVLKKLIMAIGTDSFIDLAQSYM